MDYSQPLVRYWGRKPISVILKYIKEEDEIIVDPFGGAGSIILAALLANKKFIYSDINIYAWLVTHVQVASADPEEYSNAINLIIDELERRKENLPNYSPLKNDYLRYTNGTPFYKKRNIERVTQLFSKRNYNLLRYILELIDRISDRVSFRTAMALYLTHAAILFDASKMKRKNSGSWGVPCYWIPKNHLEESPIKLFKRRSKSFLRYFKSFRGVSVNYVENMSNSLLLKSAFSLKYVPEYTVITDPPHTDEVQYLELSYFYWAWLRNSNFPKLLERKMGKKIRMHFKAELTVNPKQGKNIKTYLLRLKRLLSKFKKARRVVLIMHEERVNILKELEKTLARYYYIQKFEEKSRQRKIGPRGSDVFNVYVLKSKSR